ncbi:tRNA (adenosine(37)-N6)-dimethylallyltransferase MiaA [Sciscionella marina]|uniref:tRNA (adenosine(37)-N6)-dimethylallyltransferase MiaA n=1 Tax=Sciscionella marina TaxID=508770 RepID=UPI00039E7009|nr:tRNA (adenosine(37)-N6)-dimethylallyltransferase MiaA [Sciscionella marina]
MTTPAQTPVAIVGPTATGKSDLAVELAARFEGEIVNADAMQLYRGMDIGTAKVPPEQRRGIRHHQLDVLEVRETASVAAYQRYARAAVESVLAAGRVPVIVGGSGLYVRAILDELEFPGTDPVIRERLHAQADREGTPAMYERLRMHDPVAAAEILPSNTRRIVRALEVFELTGRPFSASMPKPGPARYGATLIGLDREVDELDERVDARVEHMFAAGLVEETGELCTHGLREGLTASRALGYRQVLEYFDGTRTLDEARQETARATRRFVRRQRSWFRRDKRLRWFDAGRADLLERVLDSVA